MAKYIPVNNFRCRTCGYVLISLWHHHFVICKCKNFIDGGFGNVTRRGGNFEDMETLPLYLKVSNETKRETKNVR